MGGVTGGLQFTYISLDDFRIVRDGLWGCLEREYPRSPEYFRIPSL